MTAALNTVHVPITVPDLAFLLLCTAAVLVVLYVASGRWAALVVLWGKWTQQGLRRVSVSLVKPGRILGGWE